MKNKIKVAFVSIEKSTDITKSSGTTFFLKTAISQPEVEVLVIDKLNLRIPLKVRIKQLIGKLINKKYHPFRNKKVLKLIAKQIQNKITDDVDFILASSSLPITYLKTKTPMFFYTDATFHSMLDFYFPINQLSKETLKEGDEHEQKSISKATGIFYSSHWAANDAINYYKANKDKVKVVLQGSNLTSKLTLIEAEEQIKKRQEDPCIKILFIGVDWKRKGGDIVIKTLNLLHNLGYKVKLDIVGISRKPLKKTPYYCKNHGFINKNTKEGQKALDKLYLNADFLFVPSRQECMAIVFAEANSYAVPSITTNVGGNPTIVENNQNGFTFDVNTSPEKYKDIIIELKKDKEKYQQIALNAYHKSVTETNWNVVGRKIINHMKNLST